MNRKQLLRSVYVYVAYWTFFIFGRGKNASDEIIWRTPCSTSADPLGVADPRLKTSALGLNHTLQSDCLSSEHRIMWLHSQVSQRQSSGNILKAPDHNTR